MYFAHESYALLPFVFKSELYRNLITSSGVQKAPSAFYLCDRVLGWTVETVLTTVKNGHG